MRERKYDFDGIIKKVRKELGETQEEFGKRFHIGGTAISKFEACALKTPKEIYAFLVEWNTRQI